MEAYTRVRDNLESTFMEKYGVKDVRKLADKVREFRAELQDIARNHASEEGQGG